MSFFSLLYIFFLGFTRDFDSLFLGLISPILGGHGSLQLWRRRRRRGEEICRFCRRLLLMGSEIHQIWDLLHKILRRLRLLLPPQQRRALPLPVEVELVALEEGPPAVGAEEVP